MISHKATQSNPTISRIPRISIPHQIEPSHSDIKVTANIDNANEQVRMAKAGIHHRKFNFHHGRNNIGMIVLRKPFQLIPGMNLTCTSPWVVPIRSP